jgi:nucleotide-binding universal stress UspA family protein
MFEKILLPLDGSAMAERSIPHAVEFARIFKSKILVFHVMESETSAERIVHTEPLNWQLHKAKTELYLHKIANQIRSSLSLPELEDESDCEDRVTVTILEGKVAESIVDFAHKEDIDLLVISSHGSSGLSRWNLNSVTTKVVNLIYKPVLIIRGYAVEGSDPIHPRYERIMLPIDCSRRSECSLNAGFTIAKYFRSRLILTSVIKPPEISAIDPYNQELQLLNNQFIELSRKTVQRYMDELSQRIGAENEIRIIEDHRIVQAIINLANDEKVDLLIFCAHGYTGELSWPFGAVARGFIEYSIKPILVIQDLTHLDVLPTDASQATDLTRSRD